MNATIAQGHHPHVQKSAETHIMQILQLYSAQAMLRQYVTTTVENWYGLSWEDANSLIVASETSVLGGVTRNYLGKVKVTLGSGNVLIWQTFEGAWGTKISTSCQRMGNTNLYQVQRTTVEMDVTNIGGTMEKI